MIRSIVGVPVALLHDPLHGRLDVTLVDVAAFRLLPSCFDPAVEEVAGGEERDEEYVGFGWVVGDESVGGEFGGSGGEELVEEEFRVVCRPAALGDSGFGEGEMWRKGVGL